ncbi:unnamed protein product, partial [Polarella glacialis]
QDEPQLREALEAQDAEIDNLKAQLRAFQESDQRDFLNDNSDQLANIISTKNQVILDLQAQLRALQGTEPDGAASQGGSTAEA